VNSRFPVNGTQPLNSLDTDIIDSFGPELISFEGFVLLLCIAAIVIGFSYAIRLLKALFRIINWLLNASIKGIFFLSVITCLFVLFGDFDFPQTPCGYEVEAYKKPYNNAQELSSIDFKTKYPNEIEWGIRIASSPSKIVSKRLQSIFSKEYYTIILESPEGGFSLFVVGEQPWDFKNASSIKAQFNLTGQVIKIRKTKRKT